MRRQGITHVHRVKVPQGDGSAASSLERTTVKPRRHIPDSTYLVTRRCLEGVYRLVPDGKVNAILLYCLLYASQKHGIELHGFCFMSNHFHLVLTAPRAQLGEFMHWLDLYTSKCLNCLYGRRGAIWEPGSYSSQELHRKEDIVSKLAYVACNPVQAALVKRPGQWPGNISLPRHFLEGYDFTATRPKVFFRQAENGLSGFQESRGVSQPSGRGHSKAKRRHTQRFAAYEKEVRGENEASHGPEPSAREPVDQARPTALHRV